MDRKFNIVAALAAAGLAFAAGPALAYIGPGAGLSLLGALWGVIAAVAAALLFLLVWPLRRLMRQRSTNQRATVQRTGATRPEQPQGSGHLHSR